MRKVFVAALTTRVGLALLAQLVGTRVEALSVTERSPNLGGTRLGNSPARRNVTIVISGHVAR